ncbi:anaerobic sulfatase maturase [Candidatus Poribacteria bacterium]|nr:anaerobic sulfatase maturase [Candidatus Poribacteria bacterium]
MARASRKFQVFVKPVGSKCNLSCRYCYYLEKEYLYPGDEVFRMPVNILEEYIIQHINASTDPVIRFSWHGGEPTILGIDYFRNIVNLQRKHRPANRQIANGIQTNGTLLNEEWCEFFERERFAVGLSLDGPQEMHDRCRVTKDQKPTLERVMKGYELLRRYNIQCDILCVVNSYNVQYPTRLYGFFKHIKARYISFLPLVEQQKDTSRGVSDDTVSAEAFGHFLCAIFDEWKNNDIGKIDIQIFEEASRLAFGQEHSLCMFRKTCGDIPVVEHNGDFFSCDHFVDNEYKIGNIQDTSLLEMLKSPEQRKFGQNKLDTLPRYCRECEVRDMCNGECPKNRFIQTPDGEDGLNYLCAGYREFFNHCRPFVDQLAILQRQNNIEIQIQTTKTKLQPNTEVGRNDPCPCGSGLKYKKCCLLKRS